MSKNRQQKNIVDLNALTIAYMILDYIANVLEDEKLFVKKELRFIAKPKTKLQKRLADDYVKFFQYLHKPLVENPHLEELIKQKMEKAYEATKDSKAWKSGITYIFIALSLMDMFARNYNKVIHQNRVDKLFKLLREEGKYEDGEKIGLFDEYLVNSSKIAEMLYKNVGGKNVSKTA